MKELEEYINKYIKEKENISYCGFMNFLYDKNWELGLEIVDDKKLQELIKTRIYII